MARRSGTLLASIAGCVGAALMAVGVTVDRAAAISAAAAPPKVPPAVHTGGTAIVHARMFDGVRFLAAATVVFEGDRIVSVGEGADVPAGATLVDGTGKTLLPGLIDAHTHVQEGSLERAVVFGVTTELDMFADPEFVRRQRTEQATGAPVHTRADVWSAGILVTAPGGHGTEFGFAIPTLNSAQEAQVFVDARLAEGSDYIKIVEDDGALYGMHWPTLDRGELGAVVAAAHWRQKLALAHVGSQRDARAAIEAGADGLVHLFADTPPAADFAALVRERRAFVVPTLTVLESETGVTAATLARDPRIAPRLTRTEKDALMSAFALPGRSRSLSLDHARAAVRALAAAGVPLLAGTDAGNPGTAHGASLHHELELLVSAGLSPTEALVAATSTPARVFGLRDRGRIAPGLRADLVLVDGDPEHDITATRAIARIWRNGAVVER